MKLRILIYCLIFSLGAFANDNNSSSNALLKNRLKSYELDSHEKFQNKLDEINKEYLANRSAEFVKEELGFFRIWGEAFKLWESDFKKENRWRPRVEKYFRTTSYQSKIQKELDTYTKIIYEQRVELLNMTTTKHLISANVIESIEIDSELIQNVISSVENLAINEAILEIAEFTLIPFVIWLLVFLFGIKIHPSISIVATILLIGYSIYKSISIENDLEKTMIELTSRNTDNLKIEVKPALIENTNSYYYEEE